MLAAGRGRVLQKSNRFSKEVYVKKILIFLLLSAAVHAQAQTYDWEISPGLLTSWTVYNDLIRITVSSDNQDAFCSQYFYIVQIGGGGMELSDGKAKAGDDTVAYITYRPGYANCNILYSGMAGEAVIYQFPGWFHPEKAFRIFYTPPFSQQTFFDIPEEPRLAMPELSTRTPDNATCESFRTKGFFGFPTRNQMLLCAWIGTYADKNALYFNALVTNDAITLAPEDLTLFQGETTVTSLSYWADNSTSAILYCPDCNREIPAGGAIAGVVYELPPSWDWSQPFTIRFQGQDINVSDRRLCAAYFVLGEGDPAVAALRRFSDRRLAGSAAGRELIALYYRCSPRLIAVLEQSPRLRAAVRSGLKQFAAALE
jgi:hypothetical protein